MVGQKILLFWKVLKCLLVSFVSFFDLPRHPWDRNVMMTNFLFSPLLLSSLSTVTFLLFLPPACLFLPPSFFVFLMSTLNRNRSFRISEQGRSGQVAFSLSLSRCVCCLDMFQKFLLFSFCILVFLILVFFSLPFWYFSLAINDNKMNPTPPPPKKKLTCFSFFW